MLRSCLTQLSKLDLDDVFAYKSTRMVSIRDRRLGLLHKFFLLLILLYIIVYQILHLQAWKVQAPTVGTTRLLVTSPPPALQEGPGSPYCGNGTYQWHGQTVKQNPCLFWDQFDAVYPATEASATFITTRLTRTKQALSSNCRELQSPSCSYRNVSTDVFFVTDVGLTTVQLYHAISAPSINISRDVSQMQGQLLDSTGKQMDPCVAYAARGYACPADVGLNRGGSNSDKIPILALMMAAGVNSLNEPVGSLLTETKRYGGFILLVEIHYTNYAQANPWHVEYQYSVRVVPNAEFKTREIIPPPGTLSSSRMLLDRHGIRIVVTQDGEIGTFNFSGLLIRLVTSLALLAIAKTTVDFLLKNCMRLKFLYRQYKFVTSIDFSDLTEEEQIAFKKHDLVNPTPKIPEHLLTERNNSDDQVASSCTT